MICEDQFLQKINTGLCELNEDIKKEQQKRGIQKQDPAPPGLFSTDPRASKPGSVMIKGAGINIYIYIYII